MDLSRNLICNFFPKFEELNDKKVIHIFNSLGIEVESIFEFEKTNNLIIGEILDVKKHENADTLNVCKVNIGNSKTHTIICGATNVAKGQKVIVALKDAELFNGLKIEYREIRGIKSEGMICAYSELTSRNQYMNKDEDDHIIVLPSVSKVGDKNPLKIIGFNDKIYQISLPSNRNELNSIFGIIYEMQSFLKVKKDYLFKNLNKFNESKFNLTNKLTENHFLIEIDNDEYNNSNFIIKTFLMNSGVIPSNSIEDIAKLNEILCGIPINAFTNIENKKLEICKLEKSIKINLKNYGRVSLQKGDVVLKNGDNIISLLNIDVVKEYAVNNQSKKIFFISTLINPIDIRKTSNRLKIINNSIKLSNKNISSWWYKKSLDMFVELLKPKFKKLYINFKYKENVNNKIDFNFNKINDLLGIYLDKENIKSILNSFDYKIKNNLIEAPINRIDIENDHDFIEDILKVEGIENIPEIPVNNAYININYNYENELINKINDLLIYRGFYLIKSYNLTSKDNIENYNYFNYKKEVRISNPISSDREYMKLSLFENVLTCYSYNESLKNDLLPIFEIQDIYFNHKKRKHLVVSVAQNINFITSKIKNDIFFLKSIIESIALINNKKISFQKEVKNEWACIKDSLIIFLDDINIGYITRINPNELKKYKIKNNDVYIMEVDITNLLVLNNEETINIGQLENKHKIIRELSISMPKDYDLNNFYKLINSIDLINNLKIINIFEKENEISYSVKFNLNSNENQIQENFQKVLDFFRKNNLKIYE